MKQKIDKAYLAKVLGFERYCYNQHDDNMELLEKANNGDEQTINVLQSNKAVSLKSGLQNSTFKQDNSFNKNIINTNSVQYMIKIKCYHKKFYKS